MIHKPHFLLYSAKQTRDFYHFLFGAVGNQMCTHIFQLHHLEDGMKAVLGSVLGIREGALAGLVFKGNCIEIPM